MNKGSKGNRDTDEPGARMPVFTRGYLSPWSEPTSSQLLSAWKHMHWMTAGSAPRLSSIRRWPERVSHTRMSVPRSEAARGGRGEGGGRACGCVEGVQEGV
jgi:hypothetical protein